LHYEKNIFCYFFLAVIQNQRNKTEVQLVKKTIIKPPIKKDNTADAILAKKKFLFCVTTFAILPLMPVG
jgi:hypothetical protein